MVKFDIKATLKEHYLFEYPIHQLIETFILVFNKEKKELIRQFEKRLEPLYGEHSFSSTVFNISNMIVYKYFNGELSFSEQAYITCNIFKEYPFYDKRIK